MRNIIFFDIDGTLIDHTKKIYDVSESLKEGLKELRQNGDKFFISTGRAIKSVPDEIKALNPDGYSLSAGAYVLVEGEELKNRYFSEKLLDDLMEAMNPYKPLILFECGKNVYINDFAPELGWILDTFRIHEENLIKVRDHRGLKVNKLSVTFLNETDADCLEGFDKKGVQILPQPVELSYDITSADVTKKDGIKTITDHYEYLRPFRTIAFGDNINDIEMIEFADVGVAMGSGKEELKKAADMVCDSVENDGIYKALKELDVIK